MLDTPISFAKRLPPDPDWRHVSPELDRAGRGRRWLAAGMLCVVGCGFIGMLALLLPEIQENRMHLEASHWFAIGFAALSAVIVVLIALSARRQNAEQAVLLEMFYGTSAPVMIADKEGRCLFANRAFTAWMGDSDEIEKRLFQYFGNDVSTVAELERLSRGAREGRMLTTDIKYRLPNGETRWRGVIARGLLGWDGVVVWRFDDVSDRREIEERLREEQSKLVDFLSEAPVGIYSVDENGRFLFVNQTLADWLGCSAADLMNGRKLHDVLAKPPTQSAPYALTTAPEGERRGDLILRGLQGRNFPVSITQTVVKSPDGLEVRTRSVVRDLTPEQRWQEALSLSEQRFQRLFTDAPVGIVLVDDQLRVIECNQTFVQLAGSTMPEVLSRDFVSLLPGGDKARATIDARLEEELKSQSISAPFEIDIGDDDQRRVLQVFVRRFTMAQTTRGGLMLHFIDATEQKKLQQQFVQSQKMQAVGQLAGGIAHDFNNLLTAMIGFCDLLLLRHKPGDQSFSDLMQIKQNANRAANLVRQLLAFSRQQTLQPTVLNLTDELADLSNLLRRLIGANIDLKVVHGRDVWPVKVDRVQLEQVVINLAVNARDAMQPAGGRLSITTRNHIQDKSQMRGQDEQPAGEFVAIEVEDQGHGIPPEIMQRIFEPFFSTKEIGAGTGLGLSTVYGIVRQTGGFIAVDSKQNVGTKFTVFLPRHIETPEEVAKAAARSKVEESTADLTGVGTIMLVEDEDAVRTFSSRALINKGYKVLEARSGEEALKVLEANMDKIDMIISDVVMPQMDGPTMVKTIRERHPEKWKKLKLIFISGYTEDRLREQFDSGEKFGFIGKPFTLKQLAEKVKEEMES